MKMTVNEGSTFPDFNSIETMNGVLDSTVRVFMDNSQKHCHCYGQLGHIGAFCRLAAKSIADQKDRWARLTLYPTQIQTNLAIKRPLTNTGLPAEVPQDPLAVDGSQEAQDPPQGSQEGAPDSFLRGVSNFRLFFASQQPDASQVNPGGQELPRDTTETSPVAALLHYPAGINLLSWF